MIYYKLIKEQDEAGNHIRIASRTSVYAHKLLEITEEQYLMDKLAGAKVYQHEPTFVNPSEYRILMHLLHS